MRRVLAAAVLVLCSALSAFAQASDPPILGPPPPELPEMIARDAQGRITMRALRVPSPLVFDGVIDEPFYRDVKPVGDFIQQFGVMSGRFAIRSKRFPPGGMALYHSRDMGRGRRPKCKC